MWHLPAACSSCTADRCCTAHVLRVSLIVAEHLQQLLPATLHDKLISREYGSGCTGIAREGSGRGSASPTRAP